MRKWLLAFFALGCLTAPVLAGTSVSEYDLTLHLHIPDSSFAATERITLLSDSDVLLDATNLSIDSITCDGQDVDFRIGDGKLNLHLSPPLKNRQVVLSIDYHAKPTTGLVIHPQEVYSGFNSDSWFPCDHTPGSKAKYRLTFTVPNSWHVTASGQQGNAMQNGDQTRYTFYQRIPISAYVFGFAAGNFEIDTMQAGNVQLQDLTTGYSHSQVDSIFDDVPNILAYFDSITGVNYPYPTYTNVLTREENEQEAVRFCMLSSDYGKEVLIEHREEWLIIHEFCHQWFGNSITCKDWSDFWLNEGLTTYLTACYKEHAFGAEEFDREMFLAHVRYDRIRGTPKDLPIVRYNYKRSSDMGGVITYYKGALVLNYLRSIIGIKAFGDGLRAYSRKYWQRSVQTSDFESEMEQASGMDLHWFFKEWVHNADSVKLRASFSLVRDSVKLTLDQTGLSVYRLPMTISVTSGGASSSHNIILDSPSKTFSFVLSDSLESLIVDAGKKLPVAVEVRKPYAMLLYESNNASSTLDRVDAMTELTSSYVNESPEHQSTIQSLLQSATRSSSRLIAQVSQNLLKKIAVTKSN